jgi:hypothetical protein
MAIFKTLKATINNKRNYLNFHVLGGAEFRYMMIFELMKLHIKEVHRIDLRITYDSSESLRSFSRFKRFDWFENGKRMKLNIKSSNLDKRFSYDQRIEKTYIDILNRFCVDNNLNHQIRRLYKEDETFDNVTHFISMMASIGNYSKMKKWFVPRIEEVYEFYKNNDKEKFIDGYLNLSQDFDFSNKLTPNMVKNAENAIKGLKLLESMNEKYYNFLTSQSFTVISKYDQNMSRI